MSRFDLLVATQLHKGVLSLPRPAAFKLGNHAVVQFELGQITLDERFDQFALAAQLHLACQHVENRLLALPGFLGRQPLQIDQQIQDIRHIDLVAADQAQFKIHLFQHRDFFRFGLFLHLIVNVEIFEVAKSSASGSGSSLASIRPSA